MKAFFLILTIFFAHIAVSQDNTYELNKKLEISFIRLEINRGNLYPNKEKRLTEVVFYKINDTISYVHRHYTVNNETNDEESSIPSSVFDRFVSKLKLLDAERLNHTNFNVTDGINYNLEFGDNTYSIHIRTNDPEEEYLKSFLEMYWFKNQ